jgi:D-arabinose 1-dehydrogenase-like Zn-dependent alcohol dehydrogenase
MGTRDELRQLVSLMELTGARPLIDKTMPLSQASDGFAAMAEGKVFGKIVFTR